MEFPDDATVLVELRSPESQGYASVAAVRYPPQELPERELALIHASEFEATGRHVVDEIGEHFEWVEFEYAGLTRVRAGNLALETRYRRPGLEGPVRARIVQVFGGDAVVELMLAYRESEEEQWAPVLDTIQESVRLPR